MKLFAKPVENQQAPPPKYSLSVTLSVRSDRGGYLNVSKDFEVSREISLEDLGRILKDVGLALDL